MEESGISVQREIKGDGQFLFMGDNRQPFQD